MSINMRPWPFRRSYSHPSHVHNGILKQPLITAIPAWVKMGMQLMEDSIGLVFDPWNWRTRLFGSQLTQSDEDSGPQREPTLTVYHPAAPAAMEVDPDAQPAADQKDLQFASSPGVERKRERKAVHFVEPEHDRTHVPAVGILSYPSEPAQLELYEAVLPAEDEPKVIDVHYDFKANRWSVDKSAAFLGREDPVAVICSKNVLRAMTYGSNTAGDSKLVPYSLNGKPQFHVNQLNDCGMIKLSGGDPAMLSASSHDIFHIVNLEEYLLHTHHDPQHTIAASGGQNMKHWVISLQQLVTILSKSHSRQDCKAAFWALVHHGFAQTVSVQLWDADDPQPEESADIEVLDWAIWVMAYKETIPKTLRQDLIRALDFFHAKVIPDSPWPAVIHPKLSIISHKGITSAIANRTRADGSVEHLTVEPRSHTPYISPTRPNEDRKIGPNGGSASPITDPFLEKDVAVRPWMPSVRDARPPPWSWHSAHAPIPHPYSRPLSPSLPDSVVAQFPVGNPRKPERERNEPLAPIEHSRAKYDGQSTVSLDSATSVLHGLCGSTSSNVGDSLSDVTSATLHSGDASIPNNCDAPVSLERVLTMVCQGKATVEEPKPGGGVSESSLAAGGNNRRTTARVQQALNRPKVGSSAYERQRPQYTDPELSESYERAMNISKRSTDTWKIAALKYGMTSDNGAPPVLSADDFGYSPGLLEFSYQMDDAVYAEQQLSRAVTATHSNMKDRREQWLREYDRLCNDRRVKRELKNQLAKEWEHLIMGGESQHGTGDPETIHAADDASHKVELRSGEPCKEPCQDASPALEPAEKTCLAEDTRNNVQNAEVENCLGQLEMADEAAACLRRMLLAASEREKQNIEHLKNLTEELNELKTSMCADAKEVHVHEAVCRTPDGSQAPFENEAQWNWGGAPRSVPVQSAETKQDHVRDAPAQVSPALDGGCKITPGMSTSRQSGVAVTDALAGSVETDKLFMGHGGTATNDELPMEASPREAESSNSVTSDARPCSVSPTCNRQSSPQANVQAESVPDPNQTTPKVSYRALLCAGPPGADSDEEIDHAVGSESKEVCKLSDSSSNGRTQHKQPNSDPSVETTLCTDKINNPFANKHCSNVMLATGPEVLLDDELPPGALVAAPEDPSNAGWQVQTSHSKEKKDASRKKCTPVKRKGKGK